MPLLSKSKKYYVWSPITVADSVVKAKIHQIPVGTEVKPSEFPKDWETLRESGAVRVTPYPENVRVSESPREAELRRINEEVKRLTSNFDYRHELEEDEADGEEIEEEDPNGDTGKPA